ncbi:serine hydrolase domain-containing protein [Aquimarina pacifica]|uniref:serine hydrolase domain-containing protein n=1 Tax=Aquimarina pacifica TaxID=1296415 RepID=UPI0004B6EE91|nr:serine hydrolase domain-containing protein [Aquimarina pacifica]
MKKLKNPLFCLLILTVSLISCKTENKTETEHLQQLKTEKINSLANRYLELNRFSGVILVANENSIIYNNNFGLADYEKKNPFSKNTSFKIGEISEIVITNMIQEMVIKYQIQLSDNISKYFPEIKYDLTLNDLLNQTPNSALGSLDQSEKNKLNHDYLRLFIEKISGKSFQENIEEYSKDLELENTYFEKTDTNLAVGYLYHNYQGNGLELQKSPVISSQNTFIKNGLKSTAHDLTKIISSNSVNKVEIEGYLEHDGFSYSVYRNPQNKISIIVLSNRRHPVAKEISNSIDAIINDKEYRIPLARKELDIDKKLLKDYSGSYAINENTNFQVVVQNDSLFVMMGPNKIHLKPQSENQFYMEQMDASMRFLRSTNNIVNEVVLLDGFLDGNRIKRIRK